jgi:hypothetical protein
MALDSADKAWLQQAIIEPVASLAQDVARLRTDLAVTRTEMMGHMTATRCRQVTEHEDRRHDVAKLWGLISAVVAVTVGAVELLRLLAAH